MKKRFTEEQINGFLKEVDAGIHPGEGAVPQTGLFGGQLLLLAQHVWRHDRPWQEVYGV